MLFICLFSTVRWREKRGHLFSREFSFILSLILIGFEKYLEEAVHDRYLLIRYDDMVFF